MRKNRKKIIGTLLGIMASVSSAGATQNVPNTGSANTGIADSKNEEQNKFKKRGEVKVNRLLRALDALLKLELCNELASTIPGLRKFSRTFIRPYVSNYRIVHGFRGYVMRHDNPSYTADVFKLSGDDGHDFRVRVGRGDGIFLINNDHTCDTSPLESVDFAPVERVKLSEYLSEPHINLVVEAKANGSDTCYPLSEARDSWSIDDAAYAIGQVNKLIDIINDQKIDPHEKKNKIKEQFGSNVVFVAGKQGEQGEQNNQPKKFKKFRIFLGKRKWSILPDAKKIAEEKFLAGGLGGNVEKPLDDVDNKQYIDAEIERLKGAWAKLDHSNDLRCYAEFELIEVTKTK